MPADSISPRTTSRNESRSTWAVDDIGGSETGNLKAGVTPPGNIEYPAIARARAFEGLFERLAPSPEATTLGRERIAVETRTEDSAPPSRIGADRERRLFLQLEQLRRALDQRGESANYGKNSKLSGVELKGLAEQVDQVRAEIAMAFQRLAQSIASRFYGSHLSREDLGNEADVALLVAIDRFDVSRGFRFSTYATRCITNHLVKVSKREYQHRDSTRRLVEEPLGELASPEDFDLDPRELASQLLDEVEDRERRLVSLRFGLDSEFEAMSYRQIAEKCGMSAERVRQLINNFCDRARRRHAKRLGFE